MCLEKNRRQNYKIQSMRLTYLANIRIPTERTHSYAIMKMCEEFAAQGIQVELLVPNKRKIIGTDPFGYYGLKRNFSIKYLPAIDFLSKRGATGRLFFWIDHMIFSLAILLSGCGRDADIIYTRDYALAKLFAGRNIILEIHDIPERKNAFLTAVKKVKKIIVISDGLKEALIKEGVSRANIVVAPDGVDLEKFDIMVSQDQARQKLSLPSDKKIILYIGHLYGWKGADVLAEAAEFLKNHLVIFVGGVSAELSEFQNRHQGSANIKITPFQKRELMPFYLKAADVLVLPNKKGEAISEKYTSPLKMFEYMASGRPIVASDLPSIREILNAGNSVLVEPNNPEDLAQGIKKLIQDNNFSQQIAKQALLDVQDFTWQKRAENIFGFMKEMKN